MESFIVWIGDLAEIRDDPTGNHNARVRQYLQMLLTEARKNGTSISWNDDQEVVLAASLHDMGKMKIPDSILLKAGRLNTREFEEMKNHCLYGKELLEDMQNRIPELNDSMLKYAINIAYCHHEKWDGTGYPEGLKGDAIPLEARMLALVDVYDVLMSKRPYKSPLSYEDTMKMIIDGRGSHFDPELVDLFIPIARDMIYTNKE